MKSTLTTAAKPIAVLLLALVAVHPLLRSTLPWSDDGQLHFWRVVELDHCLRNGYFYPRWMPDMAYGYGYPLLNYYAPLSVYLAEGFHLLGLDFTAAVLAALSAATALGSLGAYLWARDTFGHAGGLITALAYAYAPYMLYNAIWRGNLAESLALGILPWTFWRLRRLTRNLGRRSLILAAFSFAALTLSHNITTLIASPLLVGYVLLLWLTGKRSHKTLGLIVGAMALGLALSAFFWLPAFFERDLVQTEKMVTTSHFDYRHNFLEPSELLSPPAPVDVTLMNPPVPRSLGWPALALAVLGMAGSWKTGRSEEWNQPSNLPAFQLSSLRWQVSGIFAGLLLCVSLTLPASRFLWERVPLLLYAGFPWRFLGPASLMAAWLGGASTLWGHGWRPELRALGVSLATFVVVGFSMTWLYPRYLTAIENPTPINLIAFELESGALGTTSVGEYLPISVKELPDTRRLEAQYLAGGAVRRLALESLPEGATILSEEWRLLGGDVMVGSPSDWTATLPLPANLDSGPYALDLQLLDATGEPVGVSTALGEAGRIKVVAPDRQTAIPPMEHRLDANLGDRATLLGYDLEPAAAQPGKTIHLTLYWHAEQTMTRSYAVFAHLLDAESRIVAQHDSLPAGWTRPTTDWLPGEVLADVHDLVLQPDVPVSVYLLEVGLYDPTTNVRLPVLDATGQILGDRVLLEPVHAEP